MKRAKRLLLSSAYCAAVSFIGAWIGIFYGRYVFVIYAITAVSVAIYLVGQRWLQDRLFFIIGSFVLMLFLVYLCSIAWAALIIELFTNI